MWNEPALYYVSFVKLGDAWTLCIAHFRSNDFRSTWYIALSMGNP